MNVYMHIHLDYCAFQSRLLCYLIPIILIRDIRFLGVWVWACIWVWILVEGWVLPPISLGFS